MSSSAGVASLGVVLFTDLVGSTELRSSLGESAADDLRRQHDQLVAEAVHAHAGSVVKGLGDGVMASFPGAAEAVLAGVAVQRAVERWNRRSETRIALRIGVSAGDVTWENGDCFGTPVVEAARLCASAEGGQVLISDVVRLLAGSRNSLAMNPMGPLDLKGLPAPVAAWEIEWAEPFEPSVLAPIPPGLTTEGQFPFVARTGELDVVLRGLKQAVSGERRAILLAGEPGVGKTRLAAEVARRAQDDGAVVLFGRCDEELGIPFQPFVEALRWAIRQIPSEELPNSLGPDRAELVRLAPELSQLLPGLEPPPSSDPDVDRARLFDAVVAWLANASAERSVVLVLDDLHWAGRPTLLLLRHLLRTSVPLRLLVVGTYRDTDLARTHPLAELLADLRREPGVERVRLGGLDGSGVRAFMEAAAGHEIDDDEATLAQLIYDETDGNPFFVGEILFHLGESGAVYQTSDGRWHVQTGQLSIPEGVREVVGRRVSRLSEAASSVLATAAVIGSQFSLAVLGAVSELPADKVEAGTEEALRAGLIREAMDRKLVYRFSHALVRSTLYEEISTLRRVRLHRQVGEAIEAVHAARLDEHVVELAHHFSEAAASGDVVKAIKYCRQAGQRALRQAAFDEAVIWAERALELHRASSPSVDDRLGCELLIELGFAQREAGEPAHRQTFLDAGRRASGIGASDLVINAAVLNTREVYARYGAVDLERVEALEAALKVCISHADCSRVACRLAIELTFSGDRGRVLGLLDQAVEAARRCGDAELIVWALTHRTMITHGPETLDEELEVLTEVASLARNCVNVMTQACAGVLFYPSIERGDVAEAAEAVLVVARLGEASRHPGLLAMAQLRRATVLTLTGRLDEAELAIEKGIDIYRRIAVPEAEIMRLGFLLPIRAAQGRAAELIDDAEAAYSAFPTLALQRSRLYGVVGRTTDARQILQDLSTEGLRDHVLAQQPWTFAAVSQALIMPRVDRPDLAALLYDMLAPYPGQFCIGPSGNAISGTDHALAACAAALGHLDLAEGHLRGAIHLYERMVAPIFTGRAKLMLASLLCEAGRTTEAAEVGSAGNDGLTGVGLKPTSLVLGDHP